MKKLRLSAQISWIKFRLHPLMAFQHSGFVLISIGIFFPILVLIGAPEIFNFNGFTVAMLSLLMTFFLLPLLDALCIAFSCRNNKCIQKLCERIGAWADKICSVLSFFDLDNEKKTRLQEQLQKMALDLERAQLGSVTKKAPMRKNSNRI